ncbi:MAG: hypothetical protein NXI04_08205 [Planctomycetaceae bacterium]|nr:hypothetical protein [Planctomycetaceae bacterium]
MRDFRFRAGQMALAGLLSAFGVFAIAGCEQLEDAVDDVTSSDDTPPATDSVESGPPVAEPAPVTPEPPRLVAADLIAAFESLSPEQIDDSALAAVAQTPESAAAVTVVDSANPTAVTGAGLQTLTKLPNLHTLILNGNTMAASDWNTVGQLSGLRYLEVRGTAVDDNVVAAWKDLNELQSANLSGTQITAAAGPALAALTAVTDLELASTRIDDSTIAAIASLPIRSLNLSRCRITGASMSKIGSFEGLEELDLSFTQMLGGDFKGINRSKIRRLNVGETNFGIDGFVAIKGMRELEELNVYRAGLVDHTKCNVFKTMPRLRVLNAGGNQLTNAGLKVFFKGHRSLEELQLLNCKAISDAGLAELVGVKTLKVLNLSNTSCTQAGATALKQRLPECRIVTNDGTF